MGDAQILVPGAARRIPSRCRLAGRPGTQTLTMLAATNLGLSDTVVVSHIYRKFSLDRAIAGSLADLPQKVATVTGAGSSGMALGMGKLLAYPAFALT